MAKENLARLTLRLPAEINKAVKLAAVEEGCSVNEYIERLLKDRLNIPDPLETRIEQRFAKLESRLAALEAERGE
jgi:hypothetical protein